MNFVAEAISLVKDTQGGAFNLCFYLRLAMDAIGFLSSRQLDLDNLFSVNEQVRQEKNYNSILTALGNLLEKQVRTWWDKGTIKHYLKEKIIVRSMRWEVTPQDAMDDTESVAEWLTFFNDVGLQLQDLILQEEKKNAKIAK